MLNYSNNRFKKKTTVSFYKYEKSTSSQVKVVEVGEHWRSDEFPHLMIKCTQNFHESNLDFW